MAEKPFISINSSANFLNGIKLCITKPHILYRQLAGAEQIVTFCSEKSIRDEIPLIIKFVIENRDSFTQIELAEKLISKLNLNFHKIEFNLVETVKSFIVLNHLISKNLKNCGNSHEIIVVDVVHRAAAILPLQRSKFNRPLQMQVKGHLLYAEPIYEFMKDDDENKKKFLGWIKHVLLKKTYKWVNEYDGNGNVDSLSLINLNKYNELYNHLKQKYGEHMVKVWPEGTDPAKFVYEDIAIASYLLMIWEDERKQNETDQLQSFVDLGCGNGLLVYILSSEGHSGYGIDLRKRGIWDTYPSTTILKTMAIIPSDKSLFPDIDWIIGNHSDELSPWIPIIAARSSYNCRYFLLPCCAYEFNGKKFQRRNCKKSQYHDFLDYVEKISFTCGFDTKIDRLKIPSTKRICVIGFNRQYKCDQFTEQCNNIQKFIDNESGCNSKQNIWNVQFEPRADIEKVQNCTQIDKNIEHEIILIVFQQIMAKKRFVEHFECKEWNVGGRLSLSDVIKEIPRGKLIALKSECGGLQTLLKNNSQVFKVTDGKVEIRLPIKYCDKLMEFKRKGINENDSKKFQFKQRPCWFLLNHPNGCPLSDEDCTFRH